MKWTDINDIVSALIEHHPLVQPLEVRFTDLRAWVLALPGFVDDANRCNERILEAIQLTWLDELED